MSQHKVNKIDIIILLIVVLLFIAILLAFAFTGKKQKDTPQSIEMEIDQEDNSDYNMEVYEPDTIWNEFYDLLEDNETFQN